MPTRSVGGVTGEVELGEQGANPERGLVGRVDQHHLAPHDIADRASEERVMGAAEQQCVDLCIDQRSEKTFCQDVHLIGIGLTPFDELDESGTRGAGERDRRVSTDDW